MALSSSPLRARERPAAADLQLVLLIAFLCLQLLVVPCNAQQFYCISDVDVANNRASFSFGNYEERAQVKLVGPLFKTFSLLSVVHYVHQNHSEYDRLRPASIVVCDDQAEDDGNTHSNSSDPAATYIARVSANYDGLGPMLWDLLTLGSMDVAERTNITTIVLPASPCQGMAESIHTDVFRLVLMSSGIDRDQWSIKPFSDRVTLESSQVTLFMSTGLLSLFLTFLVVPLLAMLVHRTCCYKVSKPKLFIAYHSSLFTASLVAVTFTFYWIGISVFYFVCDTVDDILFPNRFFSPMSMCLIFYVLSGLTSFTGGVFFSKCNGLKVRLSPFERVGSGLLAASVTAAIFHSLFLLLALLEDPLTVMSYLVVFLTTVILIFIALYAIIVQYRKTRFYGHFCLVVMMQTIVFMLYIVSVNSFGKLTCDGEGYVATKSYLCIVIVLALVSFALSLSIALMVAGGGRRQGGGTARRETGERGHADADPENPCSNDSAASVEGGGGGGGREVVEGKSRVADITALAQEMGFVVLIPNVVQAWQRRRRNDDSTT